MKTLLLLVGLMVQPVFSQDLKEGLVAYWDFNEKDGDTASDSSGNGHDGTLIGDPQWTNDGYFGGGLEFDQVGDEVNVPYHADLNQETFTITAWANVEPGSAGSRAVVSSRDEPPLSGYIFLRFTKQYMAVLDWHGTCTLGRYCWTCCGTW